MKTTREEREEIRRLKEKAMEEISAAGYKPVRVSDTEIHFGFKGEMVKYFPYSGWATGKSIQDGRGLRNLLKQLK